MLKLVIGNKNYSSWSFRPWLAMKVADIPFEEEFIRLYADGSNEKLRQVSPSGRVPLLKTDDGLMIWESLAILEYLAETFPEKGLWPQDRAARAHARSAANEMHAGFMALRSACPVNMRRTNPARDRGAAVEKDVHRITALWAEAREKFGQGGPFLYGQFSIADAMYAPVVSRFVTYSIAVDQDARAYMDAVQSLPAYQSWREAGSNEPWVIEEEETD